MQGAQLKRSELLFRRLQRHNDSVDTGLDREADSERASGLVDDGLNKDHLGQLPGGL